MSLKGWLRFWRRRRDELFALDADWGDACNIAIAEAQCRQHIGRVLGGGMGKAVRVVACVDGANPPTFGLLTRVPGYAIAALAAAPGLVAVVGHYAGVIR